MRERITCILANTHLHEFPDPQSQSQHPHKFFPPPLGTYKSSGSSEQAESIAWLIRVSAIHSFHMVQKGGLVNAKHQEAQFCESEAAMMFTIGQALQIILGCAATPLYHEADSYPSP